ncbi:hypothetical protein B5P43_16095 [Bacillus sp. SRB_336]|nr:hypothetical protein B5P43_16095 [Bacillus sp. SRB_336]
MFSEIHAPLVYDGGTHVPYASVSSAAAGHTVTGTSASKAWNLAGMRAAQMTVGRTFAGCGLAAACQPAT